MVSRGTAYREPLRRSNLRTLRGVAPPASPRCYFYGSISNAPPLTTDRARRNFPSPPLPSPRRRRRVLHGGEYGEGGRRADELH